MNTILTIKSLHNYSYADQKNITFAITDTG